MAIAVFFMYWQVTIYLTQEQSRHARDALAKAVYAAMFEWVVGRTNECIEAKQGEIMSEDRIFIGLLDIFGACGEASCSPVQQSAVCLFVRLLQYDIVVFFLFFFVML